MNLLTPENIDALSAEIHADNVAAGWWSDPYTGARTDRNVGEMLMLVVTELVEALDGWEHQGPDDKLPHLPMFDVELADTAIRLLDLAGGLSLNLGRLFDEMFNAGESVIEPSRLAVPANLMRVTRHLAYAMEGQRKGNHTKLEAGVGRALLAVNQLCSDHDVDLLEVIEQKRAFNRTRADHKVENRIAAGGKVC